MNTLFIGQHLIQLEECESTNQYALDYSKQNEVFEGVVVVTKHQTKGRGQRGTIWLSDVSQNLTLSVILKPTFIKVTEQFYLSAAIAVGIRNYLLKELSSDADIKIKWPNDILINKRKICGLLIENSVQGLFVTHSVIGIGLNLNQNVFPENYKATSLSNETKKFYSLEKELEKLCSCIEQQYILLRENAQKVINNYMENLYLLNETKLFMYKGNPIKATIIDVNKTGRLVLRKDSDTLISCDLKEIKYL